MTVQDVDVEGAEKVAQGAGNVRSEDKSRVVLGTLGAGSNEQRTDADSDSAPVEAVSPSPVVISDERMAEALSREGKNTSEDNHENMDCNVLMTAGKALVAHVQDFEGKIMIITLNSAAYHQGMEKELKKHWR